MSPVTGIVTEKETKDFGKSAEVPWKRALKYLGEER